MTQKRITLASFQVLYHMQPHAIDVSTSKPHAAAYVYTTVWGGLRQATSGMAAVTCLNLMWFSKMIKGLLKMLRGGQKAKKEAEGGNTQPAAAARRTSPRTSKKGV